jgi:FKBP-type peptidyl-prolyl cis-trans isomerase
MKLFVYVCLLALTFSACEAPRQMNGETTLPSGIKYKIVKRDEKGQKVKEGDYIEVHFFGLVGNDTLENSYKVAGGKPQTLNVIPVKGLPSEVLPSLQVGDSVVISVNKDTLTRRMGDARMAKYKDKPNTEYVKYFLKVYSIKSKEAFQKEMMEQEKKFQEESAAKAKKAEAEEGGKIEEYVKNSGIAFTTTTSGLRYLVTQKTAGTQAKAGDSVTVHYTGKFLDGKVFDSSVNRGEPFQFVLGTNSVIKGWDEGIALLKKGEKATLLIPSTLGYGATGAGNGVIPPFSPLVFEVELIDIKSK